MNKWKHFGCWFGFAVAAMASAPAFAGPINVTNVQVNWNQGRGLNVMEGANPASLYYAGPITFTISGGPVVVWCDDLYNDVYIGSSNIYHVVSPASYLAPLSQATIQNIAGLAFQGTMEALANTLTPDRGAEFQLAIWEQEYGNIQDLADSGIQTGVDALIGSAPSFFADMKAQGWTYDQLDSPGCDQQPNAITYQSGCQTQGQIYVRRVPEPGTIAILLAGLLGLGGLHQRRKARCKA